MLHKIQFLAFTTALWIIGSGSVRAQDALPSEMQPDTPMAEVDRFDFLVYNLDGPLPLTDNPANELYHGIWNQGATFSYPNLQLPDTLAIDLRGYCMPTPSSRINDVFGFRPRRRRVHYGLDIKVEKGDTIRAAFDGKVRTRTFNKRGYGNYVIIRHENGLETLYGHLSESLVRENQLVHAGDPIGLGGSTGRSTGNHLHFETRLLGTALNPALMFDFQNGQSTGKQYIFSRKTATKEVQSSAAYVKVRQGDTLSAIAKRSGSSVKTICKLNGITQKSIIRPGQRLRVR
ncbi:MAG: peptidoglycan DD-metalloendopeptidase family protein [Bacteroidaceae bacterium]|nr:peptidoglycan DD-metalloendopeptidase family protein [Bacteroidaceae bacterium]